MDKFQVKNQLHRIISGHDLTVLKFNGSLTIDLFKISSINDERFNSAKVGLMPDIWLTRV